MQMGRMSGTRYRARGGARHAQMDSAGNTHDANGAHEWHTLQGAWGARHAQMGSAGNTHDANGAHEWHTLQGAGGGTSCASGYAPKFQVLGRGRRGHVWLAMSGTTN